MQRYLIAFLVVFCGIAGAYAGNDPTITERTIDANNVELTLVFPVPTFDTLGQSLRLRPSAYFRPVRTGLELRLPVLTSDARVEIVKADYRDLLVGRPIISSTEEEGAARPTVTLMGTARGSKVGLLRYLAYSASGNSLHYVTRLVLRLRTTSPTLLNISSALQKNGAQLRADQNREVRPVPKGPDDLNQTPGIVADDGNVYRMEVDKNGIYHVGFRDLQKFGVDASRIDPTTLRIVSEGALVPVYVFDNQDGRFNEGDYFEFYGEQKLRKYEGKYHDQYRDPYTTIRAYYLIWGTTYSSIPPSGIARMVEESGEIREIDLSRYTDLRDASYPYTIHYERDNEYEQLELTDLNELTTTRDHNFIAILRQGENVSVDTVAPFPDLRSNRPIKFRVGLHGVSHFDLGSTDAHNIELPDIPNEQKVDVLVNQKSDLLQGVWDSQRLKFLSSDTASQLVSGATPSASLLNGAGAFDSTNSQYDFPLRVQFVNRLDTNCADCRFAVNWYDLTYDRLYAAYNDFITFRTPVGSHQGLYQFTIDNFSRSDISIYRKGISKISNVYIGGRAPKQRGIKAIFQINASEADEFLAVVDSSKLLPLKIVKDDFLDLRKFANGADYLVITSREHLSKIEGHMTPTPAERFVNLRQSQGLTGKIIDVANIYDEFSSGSKSPEGIKAFLKYAYDNWRIPPKYVLLLGSASSVVPKLTSLERDQVPTSFIQTYLYGSGASDVWYSLLDGDDYLPDLYIGRVPTFTQKDDLAYFDKVVRYEADNNPDAAWKNRSLFISGNFNEEVDNLVERATPKGATIDRLSLNLGKPYYGTDVDLVAKINSGLYFVNFMGHGGAGVWADRIEGTGRPLCVTQDIKRFTNTIYPFVSSLTCFTGAFDGTQGGALLPTMILSPTGGAVAGLATASFGFRNADTEVATYLVPNLLDTLTRSFGDRVFTAKLQYYLTQGHPGKLVPPTIMVSYNLLGDPAITPPKGIKQISVVASRRAIKAGDNILLTIRSSIQSGAARIELVDGSNSPMVPPHVVDNLPFTSGQLLYTDVVPNLTGRYGHYKVTVSNPKEYAAGSFDVAFSKGRITEVTFEPYPIPAHRDVTVTASVQSPDPIAQVNLEFVRFKEDNAGVRQELQRAIYPMTFDAPSMRYVKTLAGIDFDDASILSANVFAVTVLGDTINAVVREEIVGANADPSAWRDPYHNELTGRYYASSNGLVWRQNVFNWGAADAEATEVSLVTASGRRLGQSRVFIPKHGVTSVDIPVGEYLFRTDSVAIALRSIRADAPRNLVDSLLTNDTTAFRAIPFAVAAYLKQVGTTYKGFTANAIEFDTGKVILSISPNALGAVERTVFLGTKITDTVTTAQPDIHFIVSGGASAFRLVSDSLGEAALAGTNTLSLSLDLTNPVVAAHLDELKIYRLNSRSKLWTIEQSSVNQNRITAQISALGTFAIAYHTDRRKPIVDATIEGQVFTNKGDVPDHPRIDVVLQDENGIDVVPRKTIVKLDGNLVASSDYSMLDSLRSPTSISLRYEPSLSDGDHRVAIQTTDNNGLVSDERLLELHVSHDFKIQTLGSFPNPFADQMFLAYEIKGIPFAEEVRFEIYTVSGRLIRALQYPSSDPDKTFGFLRGGTGTPTSLGYHEVWWDGRDDGGNEAANGVYFYQLRVKTSGDSRNLTGKFARVR